VANTVKFNGKDLQTATDISAGVTPVEQQAGSKAGVSTATTQLQEQQANYRRATGQAVQGEDRRNKAAITAVTRCESLPIQHLGESDSLLR